MDITDLQRTIRRADELLTRCDFLVKREKEIYSEIKRRVTEYLKKPFEEISPDEFWRTAERICPKLVEELHKVREESSRYETEIRELLNRIPPKFQRASDIEKLFYKKTSKYEIRVGNKTYYTDKIEFVGNGYVKFRPVLVDDKIPTEIVKEVIVRADEIIDPTFSTSNVSCKLILITLIPIAAMFILPKVLR